MDNSHTQVVKWVLHFSLFTRLVLISYVRIDIQLIIAINNPPILSGRQSYLVELLNIKML